MAKKEDILFKKSCDFILTNLDVTTEELSDEQLEYWTVQDENDDAEVQRVFDLFMFAHTMVTLRKQGHGEISLNVEELNTRFEVFRTIVSLERMSRKTPVVNYKKRKIFDFDNYEVTIDIGLDVSKSPNQNIA